MFAKAAKISEIAPGKLKGVEINGHEITLANYGGKIYAFDKRCGHMSAPLDMGTLNGKIVMCPLHFAQFDITTGEKVKEALPSGEIPGLPEAVKRQFAQNEKIRSGIKTYNLNTYAVKVEGEDVLVDV